MKRLLDDISYEELKEMREDEGMSNYEIAERVGCSKQTIHRILGPQPKHIRAPLGLQSAAMARQKAEATYGSPAAYKASEEPVEAHLMVESRTVRLAGIAATYEVNEKAEIVTIIRADGNGFELKTSELEDFIIELSTISRRMKSVSPMEVW